LIPAGGAGLYTPSIPTLLKNKISIINDTNKKKIRAKIKIDCLEGAIPLPLITVKNNFSLSA